MAAGGVLLEGHQTKVTAATPGRYDSLDAPTPTRATQLLLVERASHELPESAERHAVLLAEISPPKGSEGAKNYAQRRELPIKLYELALKPHLGVLAQKRGKVKAKP